MRATPDDSVTSAVANTPGDLDDDEIVAQLRVVLFGAIETIESLVVNTMAMLLPHPDQLALVRAQPDLLPNALEESMRLVTPVAFVERWTTLPGTASSATSCSAAGSSWACRRWPRAATRRCSRIPRGSTSAGSTPAGTCRSPTASTTAWASTWRGCRGRSPSRALLARLPALRLVSAAEPVGFAFRKPVAVHISWTA